jgi:hypothetical protein
MARIFAFIDESGNPFENEIVFSTAAAWCVVARPEGREKPLESTIDSLKQYLIDVGKGKWSREIRHHELPEDLAEYLLFLAMDKAKSDDSISRGEAFWSGPPLTFTTTNQNPSALKALIPDATPQMLGNYIRLNALGNLLRPLSVYRGIGEIQIDIVLDSRVWSKCIERFDPNLKRVISGRKVERRIHYCSSAVTPGLQIADLAAGINRKYLLESKQKTGYRLLQSNALNAIVLKSAQ